MAFRIVTISGGTVVEKASNGIFDKAADADNRSQQWTIEYGDKDDQVAFQNAADGTYLRATSGAAYGAVESGSQKQWWTLQPGGPNGSVWIKCNDYQDAYLCNANGSYVSPNKVYMWPKQLNWTHALTWVFSDANSPGFSPTEWRAQASGKNTDAGANESELANLKKKLADFEKKEAAWKKREQELTAQAKGSSGDNTGSQNADLEQKEAALKKREQDLAKQEAAQKKRADELAARERELAQQPTSGSGDHSAEQAELQRKMDELRDAEEQQAKKEEELRRREAELQKRLRDAKHGGADEAALLKSENDNLKLQLAIKDLERQLDQARTASARPAATPAKSEDTQLAALRDENARLKDLLAAVIRKETEAEPHAPSNARGPKSGSIPNGTSSSGSKPAPITVARPGVAYPPGQTHGKGQPSGPQSTTGSKGTTPSGTKPGANTAARPSQSNAKGAQTNGVKPVTRPANAGGDDAPATWHDEPAYTVKPPTTHRPANGGGRNTTGGKAPPLTWHDEPGYTVEPPATNKPATAGKGKGNGTNAAVVPSNGHSNSANTSKPRGTTNASSHPAGGKSELDRLREENARLKQMHDNPTSGASPTAGKGGKPNATRPSALAPSTKPPKHVMVKEPGPGRPVSTMLAPTNRPSHNLLVKEPPKHQYPATGNVSKNELANAASTGPQAARNTTDHHDEDEEAVVFNCGHVAYPPPRKLNKRAVGWLYETDGHYALQVQNR